MFAPVCWSIAVMLVSLLGTPACLAGNFEALTVPDTNYAIPTGAVFVATTGDDRHSGTQTSPLRTVGAAIRAARPGDTIVLRAGTYREGDYAFSKPLTLQPFPHETVWIKGSQKITAWAPAGAYWCHTPWKHEFDSQTHDPGAIDPKFPHAGKPEMVFVDGQPLTQVGSLDEMTDHTFYVDDATDTLTIGLDPTDRLVEAAVHQQALRSVTAQASGTKIRGLGFMHYATPRLAGTLQADGNQTTFENNTVAWGASRGLALYHTPHAVVTGNTLIYHGLMGLGAHRCPGLVLRKNRFAANNQARFVQDGPAAEASGAKITASGNLHIRGNIFEDNLATGLWLDLSVHDATIVGNTARHNKNFGIFCELSARAILVGNIVLGNQDAGIALSNAAHIQVYNNTLADNAINLAVFDDARVNTDPAQVAQGITWITSHVTLRNNIFSHTKNICGRSSEPAAADRALLYVRDFNSTPRQAADTMIHAADCNAYYRELSHCPSVLIAWGRSHGQQAFKKLAEFQAGTGLEQRGLGSDDIPNPFFHDPSQGDYRLLENSPARGAGAALPADVASAWGLPHDVPVDLGAWQSSGREAHGHDSN